MNQSSCESVYLFVLKIRKKFIIYTYIGNKPFPDLNESRTRFGYLSFRLLVDVISAFVGQFISGEFSYVVQPFCCRSRRNQILCICHLLLQRLENKALLVFAFWSKNTTSAVERYVWWFVDDGVLLEQFGL